jgi:hypothetical protein
MSVPSVAWNSGLTTEMSATTKLANETSESWFSLLA